MTVAFVNDGIYRGPFPGQQTKFVQRTEREVFFGGAGGGGKSVNGMGKFSQQLSVESKRYAEGSITKSKCWGIYFRRTMPDLQQAIDRSWQFFKDIDPEADYNINEHIWTIPSCGDAHFQFAHMENEKTKYKYKSAEYTYIFFDELTEFTETMYEYMDTRLRTTDPVLEPMLQLCSASNPDGPGLLWVRKRFIENKEPETIYRKVTRLRDGRTRYYDSIFIPASLKDNPILYESGQYEASLLNKRPEVREAILNGNWWINPGAFLANVWDSSVHIVKNHDIPKGVKVRRSCDPGIGSPTSVTWWYEDRNGGLTGIHNLYLRNHDAAMMAARIKEVEEYYGWWDEEGNRSTLDGPIDEDAFNRQLVGGPSYATIMRDSGIRWRKGRKDRSSRFNGASEIIRRLGARVKDIDGEAKPLLRWMERCKAPIETLPILQTDPNDPNDVDTKGEDHCVAPYTLIETRNGTMPIELMAGTSGYVRDRTGSWTPYTNCRLTRRSSPTVFVVFSDGYRVQCTPDHRFRDADGIWVEAKDLAGRFCMAAGSGGSRRATTGTTTESNFTGGCGQTSMGRSQMGSTSITGTGPRQITGPRILSAFRRVLTGFITTLTHPFAGLPRAELPWPRRLRSLLTSASNVYSAGLAFAFDVSTGRGLGFAQGAATADGNTCTDQSPEHVKSAASRSLSSPALTGPGRAGTSAAGLYVVGVLTAPPSDVYCIEVPDGHEFALPNGAVISNCWDDTMYMCLERTLPKQSENQDDDDDIIDINEYRRRGAGGAAMGVPPGGW